jgi:hypothetical protein
MGGNNSGAYEVNCFFLIKRGSTEIARYEYDLADHFSPAGMVHVDLPAAGTYTYKVQAWGLAGGDYAYFHYIKLVAFEL